MCLVELGSECVQHRYPSLARIIASLSVVSECRYNERFTVLLRPFFGYTRRKLPIPLRPHFCSSSMYIIDDGDCAYF